jgi:hypothetical protein
MEKLVIIINGKGGVGKDTLCDAAAEEYAVRNVSSITPIKEMAGICGWKGDKSDKSRKFLSDLKRLVVEYNNYPNEYLLEQYREFLQSGERLLFIHIRECEEIKKVKEQFYTPCVTLLVRREADGPVNWGNKSDDEVENYPYDYIYDNSLPLEESKGKFKGFLKEILEKAE